MRKVGEKSVRREGVEDSSANPMLVFTALTLLLILAIAEIDLHRDTLKSVGVIFETENIGGHFVGP